MKIRHLLITILFYCLFSTVNAQQNLKFSIQSPEKPFQLEQILLKSDTTEVIITTTEEGFLHEPGSDFSFFIKDIANDEIYHLKGASVRYRITIPIGTKIHLYFDELNSETEKISILQGKFGKWNMNNIALQMKKIDIHSNHWYSSERDLQSILDTISDNTLLYLDNDDFATEEGFRLKNKKNLSLIFQGDANISCFILSENVFTIDECKNIQIINGHFLHPNIENNVCIGYVFDINNSENIELIRCDINGSGSIGVSGNDSKRLKITECYIHDNSNAAYAFNKNCTNIRLINNKLENNGESGAVKYSTWSELKEDKIFEKVEDKSTSLRTDSIMQKLNPVLDARKKIFLKLTAEQDSIKRSLYLLNYFQTNPFNTDQWKISCMMQFADDLYRLNNDQGDSWTKDFPACKSVTFDPENARIIYIIKKDNTVSKSMDGGQNWIVIQNGLYEGLQPSKIIHNPYRQSEVFLLCTDGIFKTNDAGFTWKMIKQCTKPTVFFIGRNNQKFFLVHSDNGIECSEDGGINWRNLSGNLPKIIIKGSGRTAEYQTVNSRSIAYADFKDHSLLLAYGDGVTYRSSDLGQTWSKINDYYATTTFFDKNDIYLAGGRIVSKNNENIWKSFLCKSDYSGTKWEELYVPEVDPNDVILGIWKTPKVPGFILKNLNNRILNLNKNEIRGLNYGVMEHSNIISKTLTKIGNKLIRFALVENKNFTDINNYGIWQTENEITWKESLIYDQDNYSYGLQMMTVSPFNPEEIWSFDKGKDHISFNCGKEWHKMDNIFNFTTFRNNSLSCFDFHYQNRDIFYLAVGSYSNYNLYRYDRTTNGYTQLRESGKYFAVSTEDSNSIVTAECEVTNDGGWTWFNFNEILRVIFREHNIYTNPSEMIPISIEGNRITIRIDYDEKIHYFISDDSGRSWQKE